MKTLFYLATLVVVASSAEAAQAALIAWDSFATNAGGNDYSIGSIECQNRTVGCGGFNSAWQCGTEAMVATNGGLSHDLTPGGTYPGHLIAFTSYSFANRALRRSLDYTPVSGTYYMSALLRKTETTNKRDILIGFADWQPVNESVYTRKAAYIGIYNGGIGFEYGPPLTRTQIMTSAQVIVGETYFALVQIDYNTSEPDTVTATIFDESSSQVDYHQYTGLNLDGIMNYFSVGTSDYAPNVSVDEWRFGTELADVMVVPSNGDYDDDGDVDGTDFLKWQRGESPVPLSQSDLTAWEENYGTPAPLAASSTAVPEPASELLIVVTALIFNLVVARHQRPGVSLIVRALRGKAAPRWCFVPHF